MGRAQPIDPSAPVEQLPPCRLCDKPCADRFMATADYQLCVEHRDAWAAWMRAQPRGVPSDVVNWLAQLDAQGELRAPREPRSAHRRARVRWMQLALPLVRRRSVQLRLLDS